MAEAGEERDGDGSDPAARARDEHVAGSGLHAAALEREHREHRREARGADGGGARRGEPGGHAHERRGRHPHALGQPAVAALAEARAVEDDQVAGAEGVGSARGDRAHRVDAGDERAGARDAGPAAEQHAVLVVDARVEDVERDLAVAGSVGAARSPLVGEVAQRDLDACRAVVGDGLLGHERAVCHAVTLRPGSGAT